MSEPLILTLGVDAVAVPCPEPRCVEGGCKAEGARHTAYWDCDTCNGLGSVYYAVQRPCREPHEHPTSTEATTCPGWLPPLTGDIEVVKRTMIALYEVDELHELVGRFTATTDTVPVAKAPTDLMPVACPVDGVGLVITWPDGRQDVLDIDVQPDDRLVRLEATDG